MMRRPFATTISMRPVGEAPALGRVSGTIIAGTNPGAEPSVPIRSARKARRHVYSRLGEIPYRRAVADRSPQPRASGPAPRACDYPYPQSSAQTLNPARRPSAEDYGWSRPASIMASFHEFLAYATWRLRTGTPRFVASCADEKLRRHDRGRHPDGEAHSPTHACSTFDLPSMRYELVIPTSRGSRPSVLT
jgi:hypothetical protein